METTNIIIPIIGKNKTAKLSGNGTCDSATPEIPKPIRVHTSIKIILKIDDPCIFMMFTSFNNSIPQMVKNIVKNVSNIIYIGNNH